MLRRSPLEAHLVAGGAVMVARAGTLVPESFGSTAGEETIAATGVGIVDRCDLVKLESLERREDGVWWPGGLLLVDPAETAPDGLPDRSDDFAVLALLGPRSGALADAAGLGEPERMALGPASLLVVVPVEEGEATWHRLHDAGEPLGVGNVGLDAYARVRAAERARAGRRS